MVFNKLGLASNALTVYNIQTMNQLTSDEQWQWIYFSADLLNNSPVLSNLSI